MRIKPIIYGVVWAGVLLGVYFGLLTLVSGWMFTKEQFAQFWYFILSLSAGFGIQIGLYVYLKNAMRRTDGSGKIVAVSGTASTGAMISCCAHYLANILPILGVAGLVSIVSQYQIELFWVGILFNLASIAYIGSKVIKMKKHE